MTTTPAAPQPVSAPAAPSPWRFTPRAIAIRLFLTCWLVYSLHLATNTVREIYLALAIADHFSFRVDDYAHMHPDLFEKPGYGWHIGANPGASMLAAIPYALCRPVVDRIVARVNRARAAAGQTEPPTYNSPWPMAREFYREAWRRGYDIKFGLAAVIMQTLCMAPVSALGVVAMFFLLRRLLGSDRTALWFALLYAFGTPVFFRTGYLNHNLMLGHFAFLGLLALWNPSGAQRLAERTRYALAGLAGGAAVLFDYSGVVLLGGLFLYGILRQWRNQREPRRALVSGAWYVLGALPPIGLLWFYQWRSFGHPFYPGQHWMPPVEWIDIGYQGFSWPQPDILAMLLVDYRFGLFLSCPLFLLALAAPWLHRRFPLMPALEFWTVLALPLGLWLFCGGISYTRLQFNTGIRYLAPAFPFLFVATTVTLRRLPRPLVYFMAVFAVAQAWSMAMYRDVERGLGLLEPLLHVFFGGFQLPSLTVLSRMGGQYGDYFAHGVSPLPLFALAAALLYGVWRWPFSPSEARLPNQARTADSPPAPHSF